MLSKNSLTEKCYPGAILRAFIDYTSRYFLLKKIKLHKDFLEYVYWCTGWFKINQIENLKSTKSIDCVTMMLSQT